MAVTEIAGGTLGSINFTAQAAVGFLNPFGAQVDAFFGATLGPLQADLTAQLNASLAAAASISISIGNPLANLQAALAAVGQLQAAITAALALPPINIAASGQLSATLALAAALEAKLGLLDIAVKALLAIKIPAVELAANAVAELGAGPAILLEFTGGTLSAHGTAIQALFNSGLSLGGGITPGDTAFGYILVTKAPVAKSGLDFVLRGI
jgi:hypothetical protein